MTRFSNWPPRVEYAAQTGFGIEKSPILSTDVDTAKPKKKKSKKQSKERLRGGKR